MATRLTDLSNASLRAALNSFAATERGVHVDLLLHLVELECRRVFLEWGYCSLWDFVHRELKWSEAMSSRRVIVARLLSRVDAVVPYLRDGRVSLCSMAILAPQITAANAVEVMEKAQGLARRDVEALAVTLGAKPAVRRKDVIKLVGEAQPIASPPAAATPPATPAAPGQTQPLGEPKGPESIADKPVAPAAPVRLHRVSFDANDNFVANLQRLREILGNAAMNDLMLRASEALLDRVDPIRRHIRRENRKARDAQKALKQTITKARDLAKVLKHRQPLAVHDEVVARDSAQCSYVSKDGTRCAERTWLHIDHIRPFAMGGSSTDVDNNRVLCAAHNLARPGATRTRPGSETCSTSV